MTVSPEGPPQTALKGDRLKLAIVVPRLTDKIVGGAELLALWLAQRLLKVGHEVEVLTTCAVDHYTWKNVLPAGLDRIGEVPVRRYRADERDIGLFAQLEHAIQGHYRLSREEELLWLRNGVVSSALEADLAKRASSYDAILALPYLFGTTYFAYATAPDRTVVIPCLHDEAYARLGVIAEMLGGARGLMFNSAPEADLALRFQKSLAPSTVVGAGFDPPGPTDPELARRLYDLPELFLLYVGRLEGGKNVPLLLENFLRYRERRSTELSLLLLGSGDVQFPAKRGIRQLQIDWQHRDSVYRAATVLCQPSRMESFSIVMMQAWLAERPIIVHAESPVTRGHCVQSNGGLWFSIYPEFEEVLDRLLRSSQLRQTLGRQGRAFVLREYSWAAVVKRLETALSAWFEQSSQPVPTLTS
ncbi:MAG: glycosyltransferase family 4 protein [Candidatus Dormibacter sp.]|uniref:glycosyltransferase family 4 protein n=1 Tax=Candidatus Dormibacter sp. TaxID=2973982 RepID=UPI000DB47690|nr:MAG: hypothetical protein DLM66_02410 [Candidatus Dormibacteraeota bacterium]